MFKINSETPFIIYGASYIGSVTGKELQRQGINILCFVDQRADEIEECMGVNVIAPKELEKLDRREAVVFVAVKNVYYHDDIVQSLNDMGYENILYKTNNAISGEMNEDEKILDKAYESIYKKGILIPDDIPVILSKKIIEFPEVAVVREDGDDVIVRMPVELVYTGNTYSQWSNVPVLALVPYLNLFRYFEGVVGYTPDGYVELCQKGAENEDLKITEKWKEYVICNRYSIYEQMRWRLEFEPEFFIENAPKAVYNTKGYFNLKTGKHRICFLVALGYGTVAIRVDKNEWKQFFNNTEKIMLEEHFLKNPKEKRAVIHPYFMGNLNYDTRKSRFNLMKILEEWYEQGIVQGNNKSSDKIIVKIKEEPYYTEFFYKMGVNVEYDS